MEIDSSETSGEQIVSVGMPNVMSKIPVTVQVMLGTATLQLSDLMDLEPGADLLLDQAVGEPVIVIVNGTRIAKGELYVLEDQGDKLGVRITELLSGSSR